MTFRAAHIPEDRPRYDTPDPDQLRAMIKESATRIMSEINDAIVAMGGSSTRPTRESLEGLTEWFCENHFHQVIGESESERADDYEPWDSRDDHHDCMFDDVATSKGGIL